MNASNKNETNLFAVAVVLTLGLSSKWPEDLEAIRRIKAAFYIKIAGCLSSQCQLLAQPYPAFVDVLKVSFELCLKTKMKIGIYR